MTTRRNILIGLGLAAGGGAIYAGSTRGRSRYEASAAALRVPLDLSATEADARNRELVRFATLAPNSHNTQPWRFDAVGDRIVIRPDLGRRCPVVDPDDHHLWVSIGCAVETLAIAASAYGFAADTAFLDGPDPGIEVMLGAGTVSVPDPLLAAIPRRQSTRSAFEGPALSHAEGRTLLAAAEGPGVSFRIIEGRPKDALRDLVMTANGTQMSDPAFLAELETWIRFSQAQALETGDGLFARSSGNPAVPAWIGRIAFPHILDPESESRRYGAHIDSSAALGLFVSAADRPAGWVETGRAFQRLALTATGLGLAHAHVNQAVEVPEVRQEIATLFGIGTGRPSLLIRIGRAADMPFSLRRPVASAMA
ncbi:MAG: Tat pathway signal protein [Pseudomonadota bacterium]